MEIIYRSFDGLEFSDEETCRFHEENEPYFVMFDSEGVTKNVKKAFVVDIRHDYGADFFVKMCEQEGTTYNGIFENDIAGVFIWSDFSDEYIRISDELLKAIEQYIKFKKE